VRLALPAPPVVTGFYRMAFAAVLMTGFLALRRTPPSRFRPGAAAAFASGLCFGTDLALWQTAVVKTSVATATFLVNTTPVALGLWTVLVLRRRLAPRFVSGAAIAMLGAAVLLGVSWKDVLDREGAWLALAAALFYSGYLLLMSAARTRAEALPAFFLATIGATVALGTIAVIRGDPFTGFPATSWAAMVAAALISQIGGVFGIVWALRYMPATLASVVLLVQPVGTALLGWIILGEALDPVQSLGGAAVLAGILLAARGPAETPR